MGSGFLMRHDEAGVRQAMPVDFKAILEGRRPDIPVQAGDIIFVPNSAAKTIGLGLLNMLPRLAQQIPEPAALAGAAAGQRLALAGGSSGHGWFSSARRPVEPVRLEAP